MIWIEVKDGEILSVHHNAGNGLVEVQDVPYDFLLVDTKETYYYDGAIKLKEHGHIDG